MNQAGHIDAVVTNDVEPSSSGPHNHTACVYHSCVDLSCTDGLLQLEEEGQKISHQCMTCETPSAMVSNQMTREGMNIIWVLLSGADYSKVRMCFLLCSVYATDILATRACRDAVHKRPSA